MITKINKILWAGVFAMLSSHSQPLTLNQVAERAPEITDVGPALSPWHKGDEMHSTATGDSLMRAARVPSPSNCPGKATFLFNGGDPAIEWRAVSADRFPYESWIAEDSVLVALPSRPRMDIMTREQFSDFELELDFKLSDSANTGIKYFVSPLRNEKGETVLNGPEYQLIDDYKHESVKDNRSPETSTGSLYLLYAPGEKVLHKTGEWNHVKIVAKGRHVEHWLNGTQILQYERGSKQFRERVAKTKFNVYEAGYGEAESGHILLQAHGDRAFFKNIRIKREIK